MINGFKTSIISFNVSPDDAEIFINGKGGYDNNSYRIAPGDYEVRIERAGLSSKTIDIHVENNSLVNFAVFLSNDGDFSFYKRKENFSSFSRLADMASASSNITIDHDKSAENFIKDFQQIYNSYISTFPIEYYEYDIENNGSLKKSVVITNDYSEECEMTLCLKAIMVGESDRGFVNSLLTKNGLKVEDYEIRYEIY
ncbi:hypothetical protein IJH15_00640 [Candidatus Saccharibacteria bacterium]|nr:hypothetical protein [Candidatus Saccharibacteria bacterium]